MRKMPPDWPGDMPRGGGAAPRRVWPAWALVACLAALPWLAKACSAWGV